MEYTEGPHTNAAYGSENTGAMRESISTKIDTTLVPYELIVSAAIGLNYGAIKYTSRNFEKGLSYKSLCGSIERHNKAIMDGEFIDSSSGIPHYTLLASSIAMLCHNIMQERIVDNRPESKAGYSVSSIAIHAQGIVDGALDPVSHDKRSLGAIAGKSPRRNHP